MNEEDVKWKKLMVRPTFVPLWIEHHMAAYEENVANYFGTGLKNHLWAPSERGIEWYVSERESEKLGNAILSKIKDGKGFLQRHIEECIDTSESMVNVARKIGDNKHGSLSSAKLWSLFE